MQSISTYLKPNPYPGRGIYLGLTPDGGQAVVAYFIMGRSENSRNRIFVREGANLRTAAQDPAKLKDPSLVIYTAIRQRENSLIVTNGDQTDTIYDTLTAGGSFEQALRGREYEPDAPNFTPRISGLLTIEDGKPAYRLSILKKGGAGCARFFYEYAPEPGQGHIIHTYSDDGDPLPSFKGEPVCLPCRDRIEAFSGELWEALDAENRVALHVRFIDLRDSSCVQCCTLDHFGGNTTEVL